VNRQAKSARGKAILRILALGVVILVTVLMFINRDQISKMTALGYPGLFIACILSNSTVFLPVPGVLVTAAMGAIFNPFWVAIVAGIGAALGEITGYLAGYSGQAIVEQKAFYEKVAAWMKRYGNVTILVLAAIPNPFFDLAGIAAGMLRMPLYKFLIFCIIGNILKMLVFAYGGLIIANLFH
jgi:membrane protein YqaA with SNARE-associated domain